MSNQPSKTIPFPGTEEFQQLFTVDEHTPEGMPPMNPIIERAMTDMFQRITDAKVRILEYVMQHDFGIGSECFSRLTKVVMDGRPDYEEYWLDFTSRESPGHFIASFSHTYGDEKPTMEVSMSFNYYTRLQGQLPDEIVNPNNPTVK